MIGAQSTLRTELTEPDRQSRTAMLMVQFLAARIAELHLQLELSSNHDTSHSVRGRIRELRDMQAVFSPPVRVDEETTITRGIYD